jgi:large subunit ribosomal protein L22
MEVKAKLKHLKISPRKARLVVDIVRGMEVEKALDQLKFVNKKATKPIEKLIKSCISNAEHNFELEKNNLFIKEIKIDEGPTLHRWMPRAFGRATPIRKRTSHVNLVLAEIKDGGEKKAKKQKIDEPVKLGEMQKEPFEKKKQTSKKLDKKEKKDENSKDEKEKEVIDPRGDGKGKHTKIEGDSKGFVDKVFRRKTG